ncbi:DUF3085 domain-containing protein (plasmid) [Streptomyces zhihengii]|uniref:DUF3085 domain-containing protein n=1 Tax=Streptomyces zhihengii TaxID=1818004 RepID=A0ABS2V4Y4_9ACTN|nr:DUF3085 domain-containing protein [Streptomyces zhihengii]MBM9624734.1 DUF3085 domain-containing protein [Streptomyces zhihengii]
MTDPTQQRPATPNNDPGNTTIPPTPHTTTPPHDTPTANTAHSQKKCTLVFPLAEVLATAEHAAAADNHKLGYAETEVAPRLWWVKDDGTYLMSNGQDPTDTRNADRLPTVVHAHGWGPGTDARSILGGDDFRKSIDLTTPLDEDTTTLLTMLRQAAAEGATCFLLKATLDEQHMTLTYITH